MPSGRVARAPSPACLRHGVKPSPPPTSIQAQVYSLFTTRLCESLLFHSLEPTQSRVFAYFLCHTETRRSSRRHLCGRFCFTLRGLMEPPPILQPNTQSLREVVPVPVQLRNLAA